jgi:hypothetical protein
MSMMSGRATVGSVFDVVSADLFVTVAGWETSVAELETMLYRTHPRSDMLRAFTITDPAAVEALTRVGAIEIRADDGFTHVEGPSFATLWDAVEDLRQKVAEAMGIAPNGASARTGCRHGMLDAARVELHVTIEGWETSVAALTALLYRTPPRSDMVRAFTIDHAGTAWALTRAGVLVRSPGDRSTHVEGSAYARLWDELQEVQRRVAAAIRAATTTPTPAVAPIASAPATRPEPAAAPPTAWTHASLGEVRADLSVTIEGRTASVDELLELLYQIPDAGARRDHAPLRDRATAARRGAARRGSDRAAPGRHRCLHDRTDLRCVRGLAAGAAGARRGDHP